MSAASGRRMGWTLEARTATLLGRFPNCTDDRATAARRHVALVTAGRHVRLWADALLQQIYIGDEVFVNLMLALVQAQEREAVAVPRAQQRPPVSPARLLAMGLPRDEAMQRAYGERA